TSVNLPYDCKYGARTMSHYCTRPKRRSPPTFKSHIRTSSSPPTCSGCGDYSQACCGVSGTLKDRRQPAGCSTISCAAFRNRKRPGCSVGDGPSCTTVDRKSTRLNSSHVKISYAVFCLKKKTSARVNKHNLLNGDT